MKYDREGKNPFDTYFSVSIEFKNASGIHMFVYSAEGFDDLYAAFCEAEEAVKNHLWEDDDV